MHQAGKPGRTSRLPGPSRLALVLAATVTAAGCGERDRLTFPTPGDGIGPVTMIDQPNGPDTTVNAGPDFFVNGKTIDPDGVDTVYFLVTGGNQNFQPLHLNQAPDTIRFGLPISTFGHAGDTILVQIHGVDTEGNQGATSSRQIVVQ